MTGEAGEAGEAGETGEETAVADEPSADEAAS